MDWKKLRAPFPAHDIEWMIVAATKKGSVINARCLAYVTARAIQERLDEVVGPENWRNEFCPGPDGGVLCGISIRLDDGRGDGEWLTRWDGAENTDIEPVKGGLSGAMKRAGAQWGIGRYLYYLPEGWAIVNAGGRFREWRKVKNTKTGESKHEGFSWDPPALPDWALPGGSGRPPAREINKQTGEIANSQMTCPVCDSPVFDNREDKRGGNIGRNFPDLRCSSPKCTGGEKDKPWAVWIPRWSEDLLAELAAAHSAEAIGTEERIKAEAIVHAEDVALMVRLQRRLNEMAGTHGEVEDAE